MARFSRELGLLVMWSLPFNDESEKLDRMTTIKIVILCTTDDCPNEILIAFELLVGI